MRIALFVITLAIISIAAADKEAAEGGSYIKILGQSGKIVVNRGSKSDETKGVVVLMSALTEVDASGSEVGKKDTAKHSVNSFANVNFSLTEPTVSTFQGLSARTINFSATLNTSSRIDVMIYIFNASGNITNGNETTEVAKGSMKFNIALSNWVWCNCTGPSNTPETGAFIDFMIEIWTKTNARKQNNSGNATPQNSTTGRGKRPDMYQIDDANNSSQLLLSTLVKVDNVWTNMPAGYPALGQNAGKQVFIFRFPRFNQTAFYDPVITLGDDATATTTTIKPSPSSSFKKAASSILLLTIASLIMFA